MPQHGTAAGDGLAALVRRADDANRALLRGNVEGHLAPIPHAEDCTLMAAFGGAPARGLDASPARLAELSRFFRAGTSQLELVQTCASGDLAVLVAVERQHAEAGGLPDQDRSLRAILVFRREASRWRPAHRHADPLVRNIGLDRAAAIARGG